uniref:Anaphase-promoting complex subunit 4-like WD40 domain-containing protein n=1 Tax=Plectus sambesii TaxID=2011161 RepID=A0A914UJB6_9BILA
MSKRSASRWTKVELGFVDADETANFGTRHEFSAPDSLYQIQTLACISPSEGAEDDKENKPSDKSGEEPVDSNGCDEGLRVVAECNGKLLAVAVNADVSIFDVSFMFRFQFVTAFDSTVTGLCWLPDVDILAVGCSNGYFSFISASKESILYRKRLQSGSSKPLTSLTSSLIGRDCVVAATFADGKRCALFLPDYADALKALKTNNMQAFKQVIANIRMEACSADFGIQSAHLMSSWNSWLLLPTSPKRPPYIAPFGSETVEALLLASGEDSSARCIRASSNGRFLFLLGTSGQLSVWDAWTHLPIFRRMIANAIDMALLQTDRATYALTDIRLILLVANGGNDENTGPTVEIRTLPSLDVVYSVVVNQGTTLIANTVDEEDGIVIVEPEKNELGCVDNLRIRTVVEAQPDMKLIRLLNKCRFQQAELFAKQFGLDLQIVYKTQLNFLLDELQGPNAEQQHFDAFMKCLASVQDDDLVGDTCLAGGTLLTRFDWIAALLNYSDTRKSADADTLEQLTRLKYNLATFRLVFGAQASFDRDGRWFDFAAGLTWPDIVVDFIARGKLPEARLIWARYQLIIGRRLGEQED